MSSLQPKIGSKISLITKTNVRFEGVLYSLDPEHYHIVLQNVRTLGTEDREAIKPVAAQPGVYEFMLFRGVNIREIKVVPEQQECVEKLPTRILSPLPAAFFSSSGTLPKQPANGQPLCEAERYVEPDTSTLQFDSANTRTQPVITNTALEQYLLRNAAENKQFYAYQCARPGYDLKYNEESWRQQQQDMPAEQTAPIKLYNSNYTQRYIGRLRTCGYYMSSRYAPINFAKDYDFEEANTAFEQLCHQFQSNMRLKNYEPAQFSNDAAAGAGAEIEREREAKEENDIAVDNKIVGKKFYNPTYSFFDSISTKVTQQCQHKMPSWRSRQLNTLTFGNAALFNENDDKRAAVAAATSPHKHFYNKRDELSFDTMSHQQQSQSHVGYKSRSQVYNNYSGNNNNTAACTARAASAITERNKAPTNARVFRNLYLKESNGDQINRKYNSVQTPPPSYSDVLRRSCYNDGKNTFNFNKQNASTNYATRSFTNSAALKFYARHNSANGETKENSSNPITAATATATKPTTIAGVVTMNLKRNQLRTLQYHENANYKLAAMTNSAKPQLKPMLPNNQRI